jgi:hypothetical protein
MPNRKTRNWQEALKYWDTWAESIRQTKKLIQTKYGDITHLIQRYSDLCYLKDTGSLTDDLRPEIRKLGMMYRNLIKEVEDIGRDFISSKMGLNYKTIYHAYFLDYWKYSIHPELSPFYGEEIEFVKKSEINVWRDSYIKKRDEKDEIVDTISWYRGTVTPREIIKQFFSPFWHDYDTIKEDSKPGRRSSKTAEIDMESIVYSFLKEQGMKHKEISAIVDYKDQEDGHGQQMSRTIGDRIKRGRELRCLCSHKKNITDN